MRILRSAWNASYVSSPCTKALNPHKISMSLVLHVPISQMQKQGTFYQVSDSYSIVPEQEIAEQLGNLSKMQIPLPSDPRLIK